MLRDALVVGISNYQHLPVLHAPAHDAEAIAHALENNGDFRVTRLPEIVQADKLQIGVKTPVTLAELESALVKLFKPKGSNIPHTALFYFSGHGLQKEAGICEGYLATSDTQPNAHFYGLSLFWLRRLLQESPVRQRIVLLDCCHSGEILNFLEADPGARTGTDRLFMAAAREYEAAYESLSGQYSVFTQALLEGLDPRRLSSGVVTNYALTDWVSNGLKHESQQPLFENSGSEIVLTRCQSGVTIPQPVVIEDRCPYRGLEPFDEEHAEYFFGREHLTDQLVDKLRTGNFIAVVGASGSGKSSVVRAGLVHKLRRGKAFSGSDRWRIQVITPTEQPFKSLANAFVDPEISAVERAEQLRRAESFLLEGGSGLTQLIRASLIAQNRNTRLVLIIDQFEEVFTLCQGMNAERDRHRFFHCLLTALRELSEQFSLVIVLRADFLSKCSFYKGLIEQIERQLVMVTPLSYDQIKASILKPAQRVGLVCDSNLVYNILLEIVGAPGELPLLQYTLMELWERRQQDANGGAPRLTLDAYAELGGVRGTLQKRADEIFYSLSPDEQRVAKRIFIGLTQLGEGTEDTRRRVLKSELVSGQLSVELVEQVLEKLVCAKLVVTNQLAPTTGHQEQVDQRLANMSTALRLAQVVRKSARSAQSSELAQNLPHIRATWKYQCQLNVSRLSQKLDTTLVPPGWGNTCQETVDIAHEALIRNWGLLRAWLDENREMLRRQRRIERAAREWQTVQQVRSPEYLLRGSRLVDATDFLHQYPHELSALAQRYIAISQAENRRTRRELRLLQVSVPCTLMVALGITFSQYRMASKNRVEKDIQLQIATSRQWSAIAQSLLQESEHDPTTALLISRLAAERGHTYEAEASLRSALQGLRLQTHWQASQQPLQQVVFSPDQQWLATTAVDGGLTLWSLQDDTLKRVLYQAEAGTAQSGVAHSSMLAFSGDGRFLVTTAQAAQVQVWEVATGALRHQFSGFAGAIAAVTVHAQTNQVAASSGKVVKIWDLATGQLKSQGVHRGIVQDLQFAPDGQRLLVTDSQSASLVQVATHRTQATFSANSQIGAARLSPDARQIAIASPQGTIWLWETHTGKRQRTFQPFFNAVPNLNSPSTEPGTTEPVTTPQLLFSATGERLAIVNATGQIAVVTVDSGAQWRIEPPLTSVSESRDRAPVAMMFNPHNQQLIVAGHHIQSPERPLVSIRDSATGQEVGTLQGHRSTIQDMQLSPDGRLIATANADGSVQLWMAEGGGELPSLELAGTPIQWASFQTRTIAPEAAASGEGSAVSAATQAGAERGGAEKILTVGADGKFRQWELVAPSSASMPEVAKPEQPQVVSQLWLRFEREHWLSGLQRVGDWFWSLDEPLAGMTTSAIAAHPPFANRPLAALSQPAAAPTTRPTPAIATFATSAAPESYLARQVSLQGKLTSVAETQDGRLIAIANSEGLVEIWQNQPNHPLQQRQVLQAASPLAPGPALPIPSPPPSTIQHLSFSQDGQKLLGVSNAKSIQVWAVDSGQLLHQLSGHEALIEKAEFSADGKKIVSASWDRTARIWDAATGHVLAILAQPDVVTSAHFSPDHQRLFLTSLDGTARVMDAATGMLQVVLAGHRGAVLDGDFSPDGKLLVTASADGTARLWDAETGVERAILRSPKTAKNAEAINRAFFSPSGRYVATLSDTGKLHLWVATWEGLLQLASDRSLRQLNPDECLRYLRLNPKACPALRLGMDKSNS